MQEILNIESISQFHEILKLPAPLHPLISLIEDNDAMGHSEIDEQLFDIRFSSELYSIMYKDKISGSLGYGRSTYDYQEGSLVFASPGQVLTSPKKEEIEGKKGWTLLFHPDLIRKSSLGSAIDNYSYFSYETNEALHLAPKEEAFILNLVYQIQEEYSQNIDQHSQLLIISNLELLLNYCMRYYDRQFYTRTNINKDFVSQFEKTLKDYFKSNKVELEGLPSTNYFGQQLNMSTNYLSDMLKKETGKSIKEHIDSYIVDKAKSILLKSNKKVSQIAYDLGFDYPQSFTRLFKNKTGTSPAEYRKLN